MHTQIPYPLIIPILFVYLFCIYTRIECNIAGYNYTQQQHLRIKVIAILNDTTGTLLQGRFVDRDCAIGMIVGSGGNICYLEKVSTVSRLADQTHLEPFGGRNGDSDKIQTIISNCNGGGAGCLPGATNTFGEPEVAIDIECGAFGDDGKINFIHTKYDETVDKNSLFTNSFTLVYYRPTTNLDASFHLYSKRHQQQQVYHQQVSLWQAFFNFHRPASDRCL